MSLDTVNTTQTPDNRTIFPFSKLEVVDELLRYFNELLLQTRDENEQKAIEQILLMYRFLPKRNYDVSDPIIPSSLICLELNQTRSYYFIAPSGGALILSLNGAALQILTPESPLGNALLGKKQGDPVVLIMKDSSQRVYQIHGAQ